MPDQHSNSSSSPTPAHPDPEVVPSPDAGDPAAALVDADVTAQTPVTGSEASLGDTTGTGTIVALGCIGATLFLIVIGLLYLGITQLFG